MPASMLNKVPQVTLAFWVIKIAATTLGETGGDALSMTLRLGYAASTVAFIAIFVAAVGAQVRARAFHPALYWFVIVATTTAGTTLSDLMTRTLGLGYVWTSVVLFVLVLVVLQIWRNVTGTISVDAITTRQAEIFYWTAIFVSNTLGTALGDFVATSAGVGYETGALIFGGLIGLVALAYGTTRIAHALLFWAAFVLTRPLGATLGDLLTKPHADGGLALGRIASSIAIAVFIALCVTFVGRAAERSSKRREREPSVGSREADASPGAADQGRPGYHVASGR